MEEALPRVRREWDLNRETESASIRVTHTEPSLTGCLIQHGRTLWPH